jgi:hypothetical protein
MAIPKTRNEFSEYCLRKLGKPVINIDVAPEQVDDAIDEALSYYFDYHYDGSSKVYLKHQVTEEDKTNKYIPISEDVNGIVGIFPVGTSFSSGGMFSAQYQFALNDMAHLSSFSMVDYYMSMTNIAFMQEILVGRQPVRYNRHVNKLEIDMNWSKINVGEFIVVEAYVNTNPDDYPDVWKDRWLQNYAASLIKYTWGSNLTKFVNGTLPGNIQFNGEKIMDDAYSEKRRLEDEMLSAYSIPPEDMVG